MHLVIDVREACRTHRAGKGQWTHGFVTELLVREHALTLCTDAALPPEWELLLQPGLHHVKRIALRGLAWHLSVAAWLSASRRTGAYVSPTSYLVPSLVGKRVPVIPVVHDLIAFRDEPHDRRATHIERLTLGRAARCAAALCTVSAATKADLLHRFPRLDPSRITPIFAGISGEPAPARADSRTIICIGTLCPRKNQLRLIRAFASLPSSIREGWNLLLIGRRGWDDKEIIDAARQTPDVAWRSDVSDAELDSLLLDAGILAFPSLYEGFGLPVLEGFARGIPVLTSDRGSLKELAGGAAFIVHPEHESSIAHGLTQLLSDPALRDDFRRRGLERAKRYSWRRTVDLFLGLPSLSLS